MSKFIVVEKVEGRKAHDMEKRISKKWHFIISMRWRIFLFNRKLLVEVVAVGQQCQKWDGNKARK